MAFFPQPCMKAQASQMQSIFCTENGRERDAERDRKERRKMREKKKETKQSLANSLFQSPEIRFNTIETPTPQKKDKLFPICSVRILFYLFYLNSIN